MPQKITYYVKSFVLLLILHLSLAKAQAQDTIIDLRVEPTWTMTPGLALDEFWNYHLLSTNTQVGSQVPYNHVWHDTTYIRDTLLLDHLHQFPNQKPMIVWDEEGNNGTSLLYPRSRVNGSWLIGYVGAWLAETDSTRRSIYRTYAEGLAEYFMCLQFYSRSHIDSLNPDGGIGDSPVEKSNVDTNVILSVQFGADYGGVGLIEAYKAFNDIRYLDAAKAAADWALEHNAYMYRVTGNCPASNSPTCSGTLLNTQSTPYYPCNIASPCLCDPCTHYSAAGFMSLQAWLFSEVYAATGDMRYIEQAIATAEEVIAWQNFYDSNDHFWPVYMPSIFDANANKFTDGGWYHFDYDPEPAPPAGTPKGDTLSSSRDFSRRMGYHNHTVRGLLSVYRILGQQTLGLDSAYRTLRNNQSMVDFKRSLTLAIKRGMNYMIDNVDTNTVPSSYGDTSYVGELRLFAQNATPPYYTNIRINTSEGLETAVMAAGYLGAFASASDCTPNDHYKLFKFQLSLAEHYRTHYLENQHPWTESEWLEGMSHGWGTFNRHYTTAEYLPNIVTLTNGGFEQKRILWELWNWPIGNNDDVRVEDSTIPGTTYHGRTGARWLHIIDSADNMPRWAAQYVYRIPAYQMDCPDMTYMVNGFANIISGTQWLYIDLLDADFNRIGVTRVPVSNTNGNYMPVGTAIPVVPGTHYVKVWLYSGNEEISEGYWDDVTMQIVNCYWARQDDSGVPATMPEAPGLILYPNPTTGIVHIRLAGADAGEIQLRVYSMSGQLVADYTYYTGPVFENEWNAAHLPDGMYFVELKNGNNYFRKKFILNH